MVASASQSLARQAFALRSVFPESMPALHRGVLTWEGRVHPHPLSASYDLRLCVTSPGRTQVFVANPQLVPNSDGLLPHVYEDGSLCLNRFGEWTFGMLVTDTLIPWACEWLVAYEVWLATNLWMGDGPDTYDPESQRNLLHRFTVAPIQRPRPKGRASRTRSTF